MNRKGFTLVEIMAASMIAAFIALVVVSTLKAVSLSAERVERDIDRADELRFALNMVRRDLSNFYRDGNYRHSRLVGSIQQGSEDMSSMITFYAVGRAKARANEPEGDVYEVEYFLLQSEDRSVLARRVQPNPDNILPVGVEQRGVLSIIAEPIEVFHVRYYDGQEWQIDWPEEMRELPELIEVSMATTPQQGAEPTVGTFMVNFVRAAGEREALEEQSEDARSQGQSGGEDNSF